VAQCDLAKSIDDAMFSSTPLEQIQGLNQLIRKPISLYEEEIETKEKELESKLEGQKTKAQSK